MLFSFCPCIIFLISFSSLFVSSFFFMSIFETAVLKYSSRKSEAYVFLVSVSGDLWCSFGSCFLVSFYALWSFIKNFTFGKTATSFSFADWVCSKEDQHCSVQHKVFSGLFWCCIFPGPVWAPTSPPPPTPNTHTHAHLCLKFGFTWFPCNLVFVFCGEMSKLLYFWN